MKSELPFVLLINRHSTDNLFPYVKKEKPLSLFHPFFSDKKNTLADENYRLAQKITRKENIFVHFPLNFERLLKKKLSVGKKNRFKAPLSEQTALLLLAAILQKEKLHNSKQILLWGMDSLWLPASEFVYHLRHLLYREADPKNYIFLSQEQNKQPRKTEQPVFAMRAQEWRTQKKNHKFFFENLAQNSTKENFLSSGCFLIQTQEFIDNSKKFLPQFYSFATQISRNNTKKNIKKDFVTSDSDVLANEKLLSSYTLEEVLLFFNNVSNDTQGTEKLAASCTDFSFSVPVSLQELLPFMEEDEFGNRKMHGDKVTFHDCENNSVFVQKTTEQEEKSSPKIILSSCQDLLVVQSQAKLWISQNQSTEKKT